MKKRGYRVFNTIKLQYTVSAKLKNSIIDSIVIISGIAVAVGIFFFLQNAQEKKDRDTLISRAKTEMQEQSYSKALSLFKKAESAFPENSTNTFEARYNIAKILAAKHQYNEALEYYNKLDLSKLSPRDKEDIGLIYYATNDIEKTKKYWEGLSLSKEHAFVLAKIYYSQDKFQEYFNELSKISKYKEPLLLLQINQKNIDEVIKSIVQAESLPSILGNDDAKIDLATFKSLIAESKKQLNLGKKDYSDLIQIAAYSNLGQCKLLFNRITALQKIFISKNIPVSQTEFYNGKCLNEVNKPDEAIPLLKNAVQADPTSIEYKETLANSYFLKKDLNTLKDIYKKIITLDKNPIHYKNLASYEYKLNHIPESLQSLEEALNISKSGDEKAVLAKTILKIKLIDQKDLEICKKEEYLSFIQKLNDSDSTLIYGHCMAYLKKNASLISYDLYSSYLAALNLSNQKKIDELLDKDTEGQITLYFNTVGQKLMQKPQN